MSVLEELSTRLTYKQPVFATVSKKREQVESYPLGYVPSFDGYRGIMTIGVLLAHTVSFFSGAMAYMDMFFTLSGYLITSLLLRDYQKNGRISLRKFYVRRIIRLYPALFSMVTAVVVLSIFFSTELEKRLWEALVTLFYAVDYFFVFGTLDLPYFRHTWSLAIEEQFYLIWPPLLIGLLALGGLAARTIVVVIGLALAFWAWRIFFVSHGAGTVYLYAAFDMRADAFLFGCALAMGLRVFDLSDYPRIVSFCRAILVPILLLMAVVGLTMNLHMRWYYYISPLFGAFPAMVCVIALTSPGTTAAKRFLGLPLLVFVGRLSYGIYLWHFPILTWLQSWTSSTMVVFLIGWGMTFAAAMLTYRFLEKPLLKARPAI